MKNNSFIIVITAIILLVIIGGVLILSFNINKKVEIGDIKSFKFHYTRGYAMNSYVNYNIDCNDKCLATIKPYEVPEKEAIQLEIDNKFLKKIETILQKYDVGKWNGFDKTDKNVLDGNSFSLNVSFTNNTRISASGYMKWPKNYKEVRDELDSLFNDLIKEETINWTFIDLDKKVWIKPHQKYNISHYEDTIEILNDINEYQDSEEQTINYKLIIDNKESTGNFTFSNNKKIKSNLDKNDKYIVNIISIRKDAVKINILRKEK